MGGIRGVCPLIFRPLTQEKVHHQAAMHCGTQTMPTSASSADLLVCFSVHSFLFGRVAELAHKQLLSLILNLQIQVRHVVDGSFDNAHGPWLQVAVHDREQEGEPGGPATARELPGAPEGPCWHFGDSKVA